LFAAGISSIFT